MKKTLWFGLLVLGLVLLSQAAYAAVFQGTIQQLNLDSNSFLLSRADQPKEELNIVVLPNAELKGIGSLDELKIGQEIQVDASQNEVTGTWEAKLVEAAAVAVAA